MPAKSRYLTTQEACELLGVTPATLYAYVSRGLIRSEAVAGNHRARRYHAEDVDTLRQRKEQRRNPARAAETALNWGTPVLESALTLITEERLYYRGYAALDLARTRSIEEVAGLMWAGRLAAPSEGVAPARVSVDLFGGLPALSVTQRLYIALAVAAEDDLHAYDLSAPRAAETGRSILRLMAGVLAGRDASEDDIATLLTNQWRPGDRAARQLISAALVLCVDHELSASSFTARVVASAASNPYRVVIAGLAALEGARHGGNLSRVRALLRDVGEPERARQTVADWLRRGESIPGFGHPLYPHGDPRARLLLDLLREAYSDAPAVRLVDATIAVVQEATGTAPNIDLALTMMEDALKLPRDSGFGLFALGRTVGWIAHAIEQYAIPTLIRPRAKYIGPPPRSTEND